ncbi:MAG: DNA translocase FtsK 4TM domain-containing protein, partial [Flavobacteriaceae bacterium]|nr:DNA translocase FtsK 4TM domain-containing protein [Flavobacteriaceae bacterium]
MAKKRTKAKGLKKTNPEVAKRRKIVFGSFLMVLGIGLTIAFISFLSHWQEDQSILSQISDRSQQANNLLNKFGASISHFFIYKGLGLAAFIMSSLIFLSGIYLFFGLKKTKLKNFWFWGILVMLWLSVFLGFFADRNTLLGGTVGLETNLYLQDYLGLTGTALLMGFLAMTYLVFRIKLTPEKIGFYFKKTKSQITADFKIEEQTPASTPPTTSPIFETTTNNIDLDIV